MNKTIGMILGLALLVPLLQSQGLDEINVVEMSWALRCYQGFRPGTTTTPETAVLPYSKPAIFDNLGKDEDLVKERDIIKSTFNLTNVLPISQRELWLRENEATGLIQIIREGENTLSIELERLDSSWLHYRITVYETNADTKAIMRSAFTIPSTMTLKDAVVFGFEDSTRSPFFLSLRITNLYAEGTEARKTGERPLAEKRYAMAAAGRKDEWTQRVTAFEEGAVVCRGEIKPPQLKSVVEPEYSENAVKNGIEGVVILELKVNEAGRVVDAMVLRSIPELDQAALDAVKKRTYEPLLVEGRPKTCVFASTVKFSLDILKAAKGEPTKKPNITAPGLYYYIPPVYPEAARAKGIGGTVILSVTLDNGGNVVAARALQSIPELDHAAIDAVKQWKYEPMLLNGSPRGVVFTVTVEFKR